MLVIYGGVDFWDLIGVNMVSFVDDSFGVSNGCSW